MRLSVPQVLLGVLCLSESINGLPTLNNGIVTLNLLQNVHENRATIFGQSLDDHLKRSSKPKKGTGSNPPTQNPPIGKPNPNNPPQTPQKKPGGQNPQTPANAPSTPADNKKYQVFYLGNCGDQGKGRELSNKGAPKGTPARKPAQVPKTPKTPVRPADDAEDDDNLKPGTKKLDMCTRKVTLEFPDYPSSGAFFTSDAATKAKWKDVAAYNAKVLDPCRDDYTFGEVKFPTGQNNDLYTPKKLPGAKDKTHFKDQWETEHVMDAQIVKRFMQDMLESRTAKIRTSMIPKMWKNSGAGDGYARSYVYNQCSYLEQFWVKRWAALNGGVNAMSYLLSVYPGDNEFKNELFILPGRLNNMKNQLFSVRGSNVLSTQRFKSTSFNQKVDELREAILLIKYLNQPEFQKAWRQVSTRLRDRLQLIEEGTNAHIRKTDDFWSKSKNNDKALLDKPNEKYKSTGLGSRWGAWIDSFVKERADKMETLILTLYKELLADWEVAQNYKDLSQADRTKFEKRLKKLAPEIKQTKISRRGLSIGRSGQMQQQVPQDPSTSLPFRPVGGGS